MADRYFDLIAFDGDDTLWHNERSYRQGRERFRQLLAAAGVCLTEQEIDAHVNRTELANLVYYGYGVSSFVLSLIETAIDLTGGRIAGGDLRGLIDLAKHMLTEEVEPFEVAREAVQALAASHPLMLVTKGDLLHQTAKLERSGLREYFRFVEVVSHKTPPAYRAILQRHGIEPQRFLMIGNSLRSDVLPVVERRRKRGVRAGRARAGRTSTPTCPSTPPTSTSSWRRSASSRRSCDGSNAATRPSKRHLHRQLHLTRIADALPQEPVEVEQRHRRQRVDVVGVVERVEHLDARNHLVAPAEPERPLQPPVEREVRVVLAIPVAAAIVAVQHARRRRDRLRRPSLDPDVDQDAAAAARRR